MNAGAGERRRYEERVVPFTSGDGLALNLINVVGEREPTRGPVVLVHGAGTRANIFRPPVRTTIVDTLIDAGYDVWLENWRASTDFPLVDWTLDQAARYDHPVAVETIVKETGHDRIKAIVHCQGSGSFAMSAVAGLVPNVDTIVTSAMTLHPVVSRKAGVKLWVAPKVVGPFLRSLNPGWGNRAPFVLPRLLSWAVRLSHRECDNTVCRMVSFAYGVGSPTLWQHENLNVETHDRFLADEFGHVPFSFFRQMDRSVRAGRIVPAEELPGLPADYTAQEPQTDARWVFLTGAKNRCFLPESQRRSYEWFSRHQPGRHSLHMVPGYGHLDMFMGQSAAEDVFPLIIDELEPQLTRP